MLLLDASRAQALACAAVIVTTVLAPAATAFAQEGAGQTQIPSTVEDFFHPGTQPNTLDDPFLPALDCDGCHGGYDDGMAAANVEPFDMWVTSMMAQAARDPVWHAALNISNNDANLSGEFCIRCHAPNAWLNGRSSNGTIDDFTPQDFDGIFCHFCHRVVDPIADPANPAADTAILDDLALAGLLPIGAGNAQYIVDPLDSRRGPFDDVPVNFHPAPIYYSPHHQESNMCGTCHDVSNPMFTRQGDGTYALNALDAAHPTGDPHDMFPEQRTFSEWAMSDFATGGVQLDGRFGGNHPTGIMESCQDCHVPDEFAGGCFAWETPPFFPREDMPVHRFLGSNTWVLPAVYSLYGSDTHIDDVQEVIDAVNANIDFLRAASDTELTEDDGNLNVRVINYTGHKLPTGYPEGRRMWLNVKFFDAGDVLVEEHGHYDDITAELTASDTKVYEAEHSFDSAVAAATGLPAGTHFHLALNNVIVKDNRIPPIGFTNAAFEAVRAEPVGYSYADGQNWDDTQFAIPTGATRAVVTLYYQVTSKEYIEFLRDNTSDTSGQTAYDEWVAQGMSTPIDMDMVEITFGGGLPGDVNGDGVVDVSDILAVIANWGFCGSCPEDVNGDGNVDVMDLLVVLANWS